MIRLQFVREAALSSDAIAWFTQGHFSHVDALMLSGQLCGARSDRVGGAKAGVHYRAPAYAKWAHQVIFNIDVTLEQQHRFRDFLDRQIGKPYDRDAIWGFVTGRDWREADSWICSELQAAALEYAGVLPRLYVPYNKISPNFLAGLVSAIGGKDITIR